MFFFFLIKWQLMNAFHLHNMKLEFSWMIRQTLPLTNENLMLLVVTVLLFFLLGIQDGEKQKLKLKTISEIILNYNFKIKHIVKLLFIFINTTAIN